MGLLKDLFSDNTSEMRNMWETIEKLRSRVEGLEAEKRYLHRHIDDRMDHIIPIHIAKTPEEIKLLCHYTNLRLLTPEDNLAKNGKLVFD